MVRIIDSAAVAGRLQRRGARAAACLGAAGRAALAGGVLLTFGGCEAVLRPAGAEGVRVMTELPEEVAALAAPYQNLQNVELRSDDGCFWYLHEGPVETTRLPLRTAEGRPICARSGDAPADATRTVRFERVAQPPDSGPDA